MAVETLAALGMLGVIALLVLLLLLRRPGSDPVLAQQLADIQQTLDRQGERLAALPAELRAELAAGLGGQAREFSGFAVEQARLLKDLQSEQTMALTRLEKAMLERLGADAAGLLERLAADAATTRAVLVDQREQVTRALTEHRQAIGDQMGLLRRDLAQGMTDIRTSLNDGHAKQAETLAREAGTSRDLLDAKLRELREGNEAKLADIQKTVNEQLQSAVEKQMNESFARVIDQFAAVQKAMTDVQAVTTQIVDIKRLFSNVKTRGGWGEAQLRALIEDILPAGSYEANRKLSEDSAELVEFAIRMPAEGGREVFLPIDAKFPTEDWDRLVMAAEAGDAEGEKAARRALDQRVRAEAKKIAAKYIRPPLTVEFAVLFLPTEGLYAEITRIPGAVEQIHREHRVLVMGPSLLPAMLRSIQMGHMTIALGEKAEMVRELLGATKAEMRQMDDVLRALGKQVRTMGNTIERAQVRTRAVERKLRGIDAVEGSRAAALLDIEEADRPPGEGDEA